MNETNILGISATLNLILLLNLYNKLRINAFTSTLEFSIGQLCRILPHVLKQKNPHESPVDSPDAETQTPLSSDPPQSAFSSLTSSSWAQPLPPRVDSPTPELTSPERQGGPGAITERDVGVIWLDAP